MKRLLLLIGLMVAISASANAATVTLTPGEANNLLVQLAYTTGGPAVIDTGLNSYTVAWNEAINGLQTAGLGVFMAPRGVAGDTFEIQVTNDNENPWDFAIALNGGAPGPFVTVPINTTVTLSALVPAGGVTQFTVVVRAILPLMGDDRTAEFHIAPVNIPEPASMILLGTGLLGLAGAARRRLRSKQ